MSVRPKMDANVFRLIEAVKPANFVTSAKIKFLRENVVEFKKNE
jgi:hypothetical protein